LAVAFLRKPPIAHLIPFMQQAEQARFRKVFTILADMGFTKLYLGLEGFPNGKAAPEPS
jgi:hypothetical protein